MQKVEVTQQQVCSHEIPKKRTRREGQQTKPNVETCEAKAKEARMKQKTQVRNQIEATVHFGPKLVSREILERQFGFLFRPNIIKSTRSSLNQTKWLTSASSLKIASVIVGL